jgi:hypothetical protein
MLKSQLTYLVSEADRRLGEGKITAEQYDAFMDKVRDRMTYSSVEDPVWMKKRRPITAPRAHKNGAWKKNLQPRSQCATVVPSPTGGTEERVNHESEVR